MLKKVLKNLSIYSLIPIITGLIGYLLLPIKSKFLSPTDYGIIGLLTSVYNFLAVIITLQIGSGLLRIYYDISEDEKKDYVGSIFLFLLLFSTLIMVIIGIILFFFFDRIFTSSHFTFSPFMLYQLLIIWLAQFSTIPLTLFIVKQQAVKKVITGLIVFSINTPLMLYFITAKKMGAEGVLLAGVIAYAIAFPIFIFLTLKNSRLIFKWEYVKRTILYSMPFIPSVLGTVIYNYSDRYIIERFMILRDVGIYTFSQNLVLPLSFILNALDAAFLPQFYKSRKSDIPGEVLIEEQKNLILILGLCVILWTYLITEMSPFINSRYIESFGLVPYFSLFWFLRYQYIFPMGVILYNKRTKYIPLIHLIPAGLNVLLNIIFIPILGLYGAICSTIFCAFVTLSLTHYFAGKLERATISYIKSLLIIFIVIFFIVSPIIVKFDRNMINIFFKVCLTFGYCIIIKWAFGFNVKKILNNEILK